MPSQRYKLTLAYRGTNYHGWQAQPPSNPVEGEAPETGPVAQPVDSVATVQRTVAQAIEAVVGHPVRLVGSSRTDAGVHARGQVAHFDTERIQIPADSLRKAVNHRLPGDILLVRVEKVPDSFDAIRSTVRKRYQYFIWNAPDRPVFLNDLAWHRHHRLDAEAMRAAAAHFIGRHDFASFARPGHGRLSTVRTIFACDVSLRPPRLVIGIEGDGFLWNMVRIMVGTLVRIGIHRHRPEQVAEMLEARDRQAAGPTAPPHGLYLQWIQTRDDEASPDAAGHDGRSDEDG